MGRCPVLRLTSDDYDISVSISSEADIEIVETLVAKLRRELKPVPATTQETAVEQPWGRGQKAPPDHEYDKDGKCKWCPAEYPRAPEDPKPGDFQPGDVPASTANRSVTP